MSRGIYIARIGKSVGKGANQYDSNRPHFHVNLLKEPKHMDILTMSGGTGWSTSGVASQQIETIYTLKHNLPYTPEILIYFYSVSYAGSTTDSRAGRYYADLFVMSGSFGAVADVLYATVDRDNIYIKHRLDDYIGGTGYVSPANNYQMRIKYFILSNDSGTTSYDTVPY